MSELEVRLAASATRRRMVVATAASALMPWRLGAAGPRVARVIWASGAGDEGRKRVRSAFAAQGFDDSRNLALAFEEIARMSDRGAVEARARRFIQARPDVIVVDGPHPELFLLQRLTRDIPVVFCNFNIDPVMAGLVQSLRRPGANLTGTSVQWDLLATKQLALLKEIRPGLRRVGRLQAKEALDEAAADETGFGKVWHALDEIVDRTAKDLGIQTTRIVLSRTASAESIRAAVRSSRVEALLVEFAFTSELFAYLQTCELPACMYFIASVRRGALVGVGFDVDEGRDQAVAIVARILRGEPPATIPVYQVTKYGVAVNLRTARAVGIEIPKSILIEAVERYE